MKILVLNGPNLNLLGQREPEVYGRMTYVELVESLARWGEELGVSVEARQSNYEGELVGWIQGAKDEGFSGLVLNPGALTHYSYAILDALRAQELPAVEVHLSNIYAREPFRAHSVTAPAARGVISGLGPLGYRFALEYLTALIRGSGL